jgi:bifunctional non-homologous end joining protein LigD
VCEIKYDGYRFQAHIREGQVSFLTRRGYDWSDKLAKLRRPLAKLMTACAILDGEVVVEGEDGKPDFNELERELGMSAGSSRLVLYLFDLLYLDGLDLRRATLIERKQVLAELLAPLDPNGAVRLSEHLEIDGAELRQHACAMGLEGIISKRKDGRYESGGTDLWTKSPCKVRDTFAVAGWALKGTKVRRLLSGRGARRKAGPCRQDRRRLDRGGEERSARAHRAVQAAHARDRAGDREAEDTMGRTRVLVDVEYRARTGKSGLLRHPRYKGFRQDMSD